MNLQEIARIKRLAVIAMASDDYLMEQLVLKGGNAIDLIYQLSSRGSFDIDYSIATEFSQTDMRSITNTIEHSLIETFQNEGFVAFDIKFTETPQNVGKLDEIEALGYKIRFKLIPLAFYSQNSKDIQTLRRNATVIGPDNRRVFEISISKFEYCVPKIPKDLDGYTIFVYTPQMLVLEKIRAICQQIPEYRQLVKSHLPTQRARDFFDIYTVTQKYPINLASAEAISTLEAIFQAKSVPLSYIQRIPDFREFHRAGFDSLKDTVTSGVQIKEFDFYFDYVIGLINS